MDRPCVSPPTSSYIIATHHHHINNSRSPPALPPTRDRTPPRSPSPPVFHPHPQHHLPPPHQHQQNPPPHPRSDYAHSEAHSRPDSRLSDSHPRHHLPPGPPPQRLSASASSVTDEVTPPASPPHKRFKSENSLPPPVPCHVDQRWVRPSPSLIVLRSLTCHLRSLALPFLVCVLCLQHYSHGPYPPPFYPYPYHHQNMPHRVEDMSVDRSIRFAPPPFSYKNARHPSITCPSHSHRSDGPAQYQFMPHSHPTPPPIATLHHSPALSASSLESTSISPSPPVGTLFLLYVHVIPFPPTDALPSYRLRSRQRPTTRTQRKLRP